MKRNLKKWLFLVGLTGPVAFNVFCSTNFLRSMWDAAVAGAADYVETTTFDLLDQANLGGG